MSKFSDAVTEVLCTALTMNMPVKFACDYARISENCFYEWLKEGKADIDAGLDTAKSQFYELIKVSQASAVMDNLEKIHEAGSDPKAWTARAWLLERVNRKQFGVNADIYEEMDKRLTEIERRQQQNSLPDALKPTE